MAHIPPTAITAPAIKRLTTTGSKSLSSSETIVVYRLLMTKTHSNQNRFSDVNTVAAIGWAVELELSTKLAFNMALVCSSMVWFSMASTVSISNACFEAHRMFCWSNMKYASTDTDTEKYTNTLQAENATLKHEPVRRLMSRGREGWSVPHHKTCCLTVGMRIFLPSPDRFFSHAHGTQHCKKHWRHSPKHLPYYLGAKTKPSWSLKQGKVGWSVIGGSRFFYSIFSLLIKHCQVGINLHLNTIGGFILDKQTVPCWNPNGWQIFRYCFSSSLPCIFFQETIELIPKKQSGNDFFFSFTNFSHLFQLGINVSVQPMHEQWSSLVRQANT